MKKVLSNSKLPTPSKFVRRVLSRSSNVSKTPQQETNPHETNTSDSIKNKSDQTILEYELTSLKEQLTILQLTVNNMQEDADKREKALANLAREKQQLSTDLRKEKRSFTNLKQQLEDERKFYYKEKEQYCNEMNDCKKLKKKISESLETKKKNVVEEELTDVLESKDQISKLKTALNQTLEANYNLSVKFLRMKNTKIALKNHLKRQQSDHEQAMQNLQIKINAIKNDIADVVDKRFMLPISPSNKKYLQIIKQNGILLHENLCLQMEVDRLTYELDYLKSNQIRQQSREKLKHTQSCPQHKKEVISTTSEEIPTKLDKKTVESKIKLKSANQGLKLRQSKSSIKQATVHDVLEKEVNQCSSKDNSSTNIVKIYERKKMEGIPEIIILTPNNELNDATLETDKVDVESISPKGSSNFGQVSTSQMGTESSDFTHTTASREAIRTQSAPEIVQTSLFVNENKP